jgi:hypothetical protein
MVLATEEGLASFGDHVMRFGCRPWLFALVLLAVPAVAPAEQAGSAPRRQYAADTPEGDFEKVLEENLQRLKGLENLRGILDRLRANKDLLKNSKLFNEDMLKRLEKIGGDFDFNDPQNRKLLGDFLDKAQKDPGWLEQMKKDIPKLGKDLPDLADKKKLDEFKKLIEPEEKPAEGGDPSPAKPPDAGQPPGGMPPQPPQAMPQGGAGDSEGDFGDTLRNWLERMKNWKGIGDLVEQSPTIQGAIEDFTLSLMNDKGGPRWDASWLEGAGNLADYAEKGWTAFDAGLANLGNININPPRISLPSFGSMPSFTVPSFGGGPAPGGGGSLAFLTYLVWVVMIGALALIFWQFWVRYSGSAGAGRAAPGWRLGAWPVDPGAVANRRELIAAFEYLSLLRLGPAAETWNHRDIAVNLAGEAPAPAGRTAADRLAGLYEQARYAPDEGPLPPEALAEARRDLCYLAGVSAA